MARTGGFVGQGPASVRAVGAWHDGAEVAGEVTRLGAPRFPGGARPGQAVDAVSGSSRATDSMAR